MTNTTIKHFYDTLNVLLDEQGFDRADFSDADMDLFEQTLARAELVLTPKNQALDVVLEQISPDLMHFVELETPDGHGVGEVSPDSGDGWVASENGGKLRRLRVTAEQIAVSGAVPVIGEAVQ